MGEPGFSSSYHMGHSTMVVPMKLFVENRRRLLEKLRKEAPESIVFLQGGVAINHYDTDTEYPFRQESFFHWLFGVTEPGFYGAIDVSSGKSYLFYPKMPLSAAVWVGKLPSDEELKIKYLVDNVLSDEDIHATLTNLNRKSILVLNGMNTDSKLTIQPPSLPSLELFKLDTNRLFPIIVELRVIKTEMEIEVLRYAAKISVEAHKHVMKNLKAGMYEYQGEALFQYYVYNFGGCRSCAYTCICASGCNASVLHYGHAAKPNNKLIKDGDFCLFDMGASYYNYSADITVTFPINGKFTKDQKIVYTAVMRAREAVFNNLCPGVYWTDMHTCAIKAMLTYLKEQNLLNKSVDEMFEAGLGAVFQPHGLGHLIGIDVHDVGGYTEGTPERPSSKHGLHTLRTARKLLPGMVVTVEPGCYFIDHVLNEAFENPRLNCFLTERINEFRGIGGVRIEDDVLITESGYELLSKDLPRTIEEIEDFMASN